VAGFARHAALALLLSSLTLAPAGALAQEVVTCQTANGPRTTAQITTELQMAGYDGPWDSAAQQAAYARASGGPVTCGATGSSAASAPASVAGYGSDLAAAGQQFAPLQAALLARDSRTAFVFFSYVGSSVQGCGSTPTPYTPTDTAQSLAASEAAFQALVSSLLAGCGDRVAVVGHSLGGLVAFRTLSDQPASRVFDVVTVDSPLGGAPGSSVNLCIDTGFCTAGAVVDDLAQLYAGWPKTTADNAAREARIRSAATRLSAWGNDGDCLYYVTLCTTIAAGALTATTVDARETQWLGISRAIRSNYSFAPHLWNIPASHLAVLENAAADIAADILPTAT
jgi:pimeloyl-ACP methyl ester carboxylesterase